MTPGDLPEILLYIAGGHIIALFMGLLFGFILGLESAQRLVLCEHHDSDPPLKEKHPTRPPPPDRPPHPRARGRF